MPDVLATLPEASCQAALCDPPYGLGLFGLAWGCVAAAERTPRLSFREPDLAHLTNAGLSLADRPSRFR